MLDHPDQFFKGHFVVRPILHRHLLEFLAPLQFLLQFEPDFTWSDHGHMCGIEEPVRHPAQEGVQFMGNMSLVRSLMVKRAAQQTGLVRALAGETRMCLNTRMELLRGDGAVLVPSAQHGPGSVYPDAEMIALMGFVIMRSHGVFPACSQGLPKQGRRPPYAENLTIVIHYQSIHQDRKKGLFFSKTPSIFSIEQGRDTGYPPPSPPYPPHALGVREY